MFRVAMKTAGMFLISAIFLTASVGGQSAHAQLRVLPQLTMLQSSATVSRWQDDRFGPIVSSDTLWTIATYYGQKRGLSVYAMMDLIVANNPRVFINNSPDRMLDGYYLDIPQINSGLDETGEYVGRAAQVAEQEAAAAADVAVVDENANANANAIVTVDPLAEEEMQAMRDQLAESIALIESLQQQNSELQADLARVTSELEALQKSVDVERQAEIELQRMAAEVTENVRAELEQQPVELAEVQVEPVVEPESAVEPEPQVTSIKPAVAQASSAKQTSPDFFQWLLQPPQIWLAIAVPVILILVIWYVWYVRRLSKEEHGTYHDVQSKRRDENATVEATSSEQVEPDAELDSAIDEANDSLAAVAATSENFAEAEQDQTHELEPEVEQELETEVEADAEVEFESQDEPESESESEQEPESELNSDDEQSLDFELAQFEPDPQEPEADTPEAEAAEVEAEADTTKDLTVAEDDPLLADLDDIDWSETSLELEPQPEAESEADSDTEFELDDADEEYVPIEKLLEEAEAEASDEAEDLYRAEDVSDVLGTVEMSNDEPDSAESVEQDVIAKLDLVHAYIEMGETEEALEMLRKIGPTDDPEIDREVAELTQQLEGSSGR